MARLHVTLSDCWQLTVFREEADGIRRQLPVWGYSVFSTSFVAGEQEEILFECGYSDRLEPDDEEEGRYGTVLLQCVRSDVEEIVYHNGTEDPLWVCNGAEQPSSPRIDPGKSLCHPFRPDPPLPSWQVPLCPERQQWTQETAADLAKMQVTPENRMAAIPWDRVRTYGVEQEKIFWFDWENWDQLCFLTVDMVRDGAMPPRLTGEELQRLRTLTIARQGGISAESPCRRPAVWMRGRTITPDQAFEVIRRCDRFFQPWPSADREEVRPPDGVWVQLLESSLFENGVGWCRPDGRIGWDGTCRIKNPLEEELLESGCLLVKQFPFLDLFFLFWDSEETEAFTPGQLALHGMPQPEFGLRFRPGRVEIYGPHDAWETFCRFQAEYGEAPETYDESEQMSRGTAGVDRAYLDRCLRANAMDPADWEWTPCPAEDAEDEVLPLRYAGLRQACARLGRIWPEPGTAQQKEE